MYWPMASTIRDQFPFGDLDLSTVHRVAAQLDGVDPDDVHAALGMARTVVELLEEASRPLAERGLSPARWRLLIAVVFQSDDRGATIGSLAGHLGVREPTVTATVDRAERDGLVERRRDPDDGRVVRVVATDGGREAVRSLLPIVAGRVSALATAVGGADEIHRMTSAIDRGIQAMRSAVPPARGPSS